MSALINLILCLLLIWQAWTVNFFSIYGAVKSYNEYFCNQKRPGETVIQSNTGLTGYLLFEYSRHGSEFVGYMISNEHSEMKVSKKNFDGSIELVEPSKIQGSQIKYEFTNCSDQFSNKICLTYQTAENHFELECRSTRNSSKMPVFEINKSTGDLIEVGYDSWENRKPMTLCKLSKIPFTCNIKKETTNLFFIIYFSVSISIFLFIILTAVNYKDYVFLRAFNKVMRYLQELGNNKKWGDFCNPMTRDPVKINVNEKYYYLSKNPFKNNIIDEEIPTCMQFLSDKEGTYEIIGNKILCTLGPNHVNTFNLTDINSKIVRKYFYTIKNDPKLCVTVNGNHYMRTIDVIREIIENNMSICWTLSESNKFFLDIELFSWELISHQFEIEDHIKRILFDHNEKFFKKLKINALLNCLNNKTAFYNKPEDINNSSWKWYCSDYKKLAEKYMNLKVFSQVDWKPSHAMISAEVAEKMNLIKIDENSRKIKIDKKVVLSEYLNESMGKRIRGDFVLRKDENINDYYSECNEVSALTREVVKQNKKILEIDMNRENRNESSNKVKQIMTEINEKCVSYKEVLNNKIETNLIKSPSYGIKRNKEDTKFLKFLLRTNFRDQEAADVKESFLKDFPDEVERKNFINNIKINRNMTKNFELHRCLEKQVNCLKRSIKFVTEKALLLENRFEILRDLPELGDEIIDIGEIFNKNRDQMFFRRPNLKKLSKKANRRRKRKTKPVKVQVLKSKYKKISNYSEVFNAIKMNRDEFELHGKFIKPAKTYIELRKVICQSFAENIFSESTKVLHNHIQGDTIEKYLKENNFQQIQELLNFDFSSRELNEEVSIDKYRLVKK